MGVCNLLPPALFSSVPFADADAFRDFLGHHAAWHRVLAQATHTPYVLTDDLRKELERHAEMHDAVAKKLGIPQAWDLVSYNLYDRESYYGFAAVHGADHQRLRVALGI